MTARAHNGPSRSGGATLEDVSTYVTQTLVVGAGAIALGLATATNAYAVAALAGSVAAALVVGVLFTYRRFSTLIVIWLFFLLQPLLVAAAGEGSAAGRLVSAADVPILLIVGSLGFFFAAREHATAVRWLLIAAGVILVCGLASDLALGVSPTPSVVGAILRLKLFLVLGAGLAVRWTPALARRALRAIVAAAIVAGIAGILDFASGGALRGLFAADLAKPLRLGYVPAGGLFRNVAVLSTFMVIAFTVLLGMTWRGMAARRVPQLLLVVLAALSTLRLKAIVSIPAAAAALAITSERVRRRLVLVAAAAALALGALTMATGSDLATGVVDQQVGRYTSEIPQPRQRLQAVSIEIARDNFPLGVGFGQFGSSPSVERGSYSPVYERYGLSQYYGFSPSDLPIHFATDTSWPGLLGEVGVVGFLVFAGTILALTLLLYRRAKEDTVQSDFSAIGFGVMVVLIVNSLGRPTLFDSFTLLTAVLIIAPGLWLASDRVRST